MPHEPTIYEMAFLSLFLANWLDLFRGHSLCFIIFITINRHLILDLLFDSTLGSSGLCMIQLGEIQFHWADLFWTYTIFKRPIPVDPEIFT